MCRHLVAAALAYQAAAEGQVHGDVAAGAWDPGAISDAALEGALRPAALQAARRMWTAGVAVTVVGGAKPAAEVHDAELTVRFLVPDALAYARCDCREPDPCEHAALAVWAFRQAQVDDGAALVDTSPPGAVPTVVLDTLDAALADLLEVGFAGADDGLSTVLADAADGCRGVGLTWPADIVDELVDQHRRYRVADATFSPLAAVRLVGEAIVRADALRAGTGAVPRLFVAGPPRARPTEVRGGRLVGLGCLVRQVGPVVHVDALLSDATSGRIAAIGRTSADGDAPFSRLADAAVSGARLHAIGSGQVLATGAKRTPGGRLQLGRRPSSVTPQAFAWDETLRPPVLAADAATARAVRASLVPAALAPRTVGRGLVALAVGGVSEARFDPAAQAVVALVHDTAGEPLVVEHPYTTRGASGAERLLSALTAVRDGRAACRWLAGFAEVHGGSLVVRPTAVVIDDGEAAMVQPWVDRADGGTADAGARWEEEGAADPVAAVLDDLAAALGVLLVSGTARADRGIIAEWERLAAAFDALGSVRLHREVSAAHASLDRRRSDPHWSPREPIDALLALLAALELVRP